MPENFKNLSLSYVLHLYTINILIKSKKSFAIKTFLDLQASEGLPSCATLEKRSKAFYEKLILGLVTLHRRNLKTKFVFTLKLIVFELNSLCLS